MICDNLQEVEQAINRSCALALRKRESVTLVGVTKMVTLEQTIELAKQGVQHLAENRPDKFLAKKANFPADLPVVWHFIGNLQRRKVKAIINEIDYFHALDSFTLAQEIEKRADKAIKCFVEVNVSGEESKHGFAPSEVADFIQSIAAFEKIQIVGVMTMAPIDADEATLHQLFKNLSELRTSIADMKLSHAPCTELSMGMSRDFPIAIEEGATFVRVGTALFKDA
jgi:pyridoxal phosphate enzyme (YggS family)